jgi:hypothetical protein
MFWLGFGIGVVVGAVLTLGVLGSIMKIMG